MDDTVKQIAILGSTGSIGQQALDIIRTLPRKFNALGLTAGQNTALLAEQINEFHPKFVSYSSSQDNAKGVSKLRTDAEYEFMSPEDIASHPEVDIVLVATSGKTGLNPTLAAIKAGKTVALANKEALVMAGEIISRELRSSGAELFPVDSEHSAIWQCLMGETGHASRIILTASGGPFYNLSPDRLEDISIEQALNHPSWKMGKKVTIDSATLMNKGLEIIGAHWLFDMPFDRINILIHPQSIIHSMVEFRDSSIKAQLSYPDMRFPIQYALSYPERLPNPDLPKLDWGYIGNLTFEQPDLARFPCLRSAIEAGKKGGTYPAVLCGADETAVGLFLSMRIRFVDIASLVAMALEKHRAVAHPSLEEIFEADSWARETVSKLAGELA